MKKVPFCLLVAALLVIICAVWADAGDLSENFSRGEFACSCCGESKVDPKLVIMLEELRKCFRKPIIVNSGYRCASHNKAVGGVVNSQHMYGKAADIWVEGVSVGRLATEALKLGFGFVKEYKTFVHVDTRKG